MTLPSTEAAGSASASRAEPHVHVRIGECDIAVAVQHVQQAVPLPPNGLGLLPRRDGALTGLLDFCGSAVPVVSIARWLPMGASSETHLQRVLVLRSGPLLIGLLVDAVMGVKPVASAAIRRVHHARTEDADELFQAVVPARGSTPMLSLLEVDRLMALCTVWSEEQGVEAGSADSAEADLQAAQALQRVRHAVFERAGQLWAVPASRVERIAPAPEPELAMRKAARTVGICRWEDRKLPLVDLGAQEGAASTLPSPWMAVLNAGRQSIGLLIDSCRQFVDLSASDTAECPMDMLLASTAVMPELGHLRVLDVDKLFGVVPEAAISELPSGQRSARSRGELGTGNTASPFIVFEADRAYASSVEGVLGVVDLPRSAVQDLLAGRRTALSWRGQTVNVVNLPSIHAAEPSHEPRLAVLLRGTSAEDPPVGIAIHSLSDWLPARSATCSRMRMGSLGEVTVLTAQQRAKRNASVVVVDLAQMAYLLG